MEIKGRITEIRNTNVVSDKFQKREFEITEQGVDYPNVFILEFIKDKTSLLDNFRVGQDVTVQANLNGRSWTNNEGKKYNFLTLQAWKIELQKEYAPEVDNTDFNAPQQDDEDLPW